MTSTSFIMLAGLKKCMPIILWGLSVAAPISEIESAEVLLAKIVCSGQTSSSSLNTARLIPIFSGTASMTMSTSSNSS